MSKKENVVTAVAEQLVLNIKSTMQLKGDSTE